MSNFKFVTVIGQIAVLAHDVGCDWQGRPIRAYAAFLMLRDARSVTNFGNADTLQRIAADSEHLEEVIAYAKGYLACMTTGRWTVMPHEWKYGCMAPAAVDVPTLLEWLALRNLPIESNSILSGQYYAVLLHHGLRPNVSV